MERRILLLALGGEVELTAKEDGLQVLARASPGLIPSAVNAGTSCLCLQGLPAVKGVFKKGEQMMAEDPSLIYTRQFENVANPAAHYMTTGPEIWSQTQGRIDIFVAGIGTGGTITGSENAACTPVSHTAPTMPAL